MKGENDASWKNQKQIFINFYQQLCSIEKLFLSEKLIFNNKKAQSLISFLSLFCAFGWALKYYVAIDGNSASCYWEKRYLFKANLEQFRLEMVDIL